MTSYAVKLDDTFESLEIYDGRSYNTIKNAGIVTVRDLVEKSEAELLQLPRFGPRTMGLVKIALRKHGFALATKPPVAVRTARRTNSPLGHKSIYPGHKGTRKVTHAAAPGGIVGYFPTDPKAWRAQEAFEAVATLEKKLKSARKKLEQVMKARVA
jgi:hypothetical protein